MTRKDFAIIAALLADANLSVVDEFGRAQAADIVMGDLCHAFASQLASDNPNFDTARFLSACGL